MAMEREEHREIEAVAAEERSDGRRCTQCGGAPQLIGYLNGGLATPDQIIEVGMDGRRLSSAEDGFAAPASDSLLGSAGASAFATSAAEVWAGVSDAVCVAGSVFAGTTAGVGVYADFERLRVLPAAAERLRKAVA